MNATLRQLKPSYSKKALFYKAPFYCSLFFFLKKMPLITTIKALCYAVLITFIVINGLNIYNYLNALQVERIETIKTILKD